MQSLVYIGCAVMALGAAALVYAFRKSIRRGVDECRGYLALLRHLRLRMSCYLEPAEVSVADFHDDSLSACGFLPVDKEGLSVAYRRAESTSHMPQSARELLGEYFSRFGEGYLEVEIGRLDECIRRLEELTEREAAEGERRGRVTAVVMAAAVLFFTLIIM